MTIINLIKYLILFLKIKKQFLLLLGSEHLLELTVADLITFFSYISKLEKNLLKSVALYFVKMFLELNNSE